MPERHQRQRRGRARPADALVMMLDADRIRFACDPYTNDMWKKASQTTTGVDELTPAVAFDASRRAIDSWANRLTHVLEHGVAPNDIALKVKLIPKHEPWEFTAKGGEYRSIVTRGILGRCLSNHLASILVETAEAILPPCAIAYRPHRHEVVHSAILSVAKAFGLDGYKYWAKLDIRDCFNRLPRKEVRAALERLGYAGRFVDLVMASVGAPRRRRVQGAWVEQNSERGCPAGLPESSTLVNILFLAFDLWMVRHCPGLIYYRYCDDLLFVGRARADVEVAVAELLSWTKLMALQLKGVSPNQSARSLVHDIRERRLVFLGAEIGEDGDVHIPQGVFDAHLAKLRFLMGRAATHAGLVLGESRYGNLGKRPAGIATHDWDDVRASIVQFHRYWFLLNRGEAKVFLGRVRQEFNVNPSTSVGPYRKTWGAALGAPHNLVGGGIAADQDDTSDPLERWVRTEVIPLIKDVQQGVPSGTHWDLLDELEDLRIRGTSDLRNEPSREGGLYTPGHCEQVESDTSCHTTYLDSPSGLPPVGVNDVKELDGSAIDAFGLTAVSRETSDGRETSETTTKGSPVPPGQPLGLELRLIFLRQEYEPAQASTRVQTDEFSSSGRPLGSWDALYREQQPATAVLNHLLDRVEKIPEARVVVAMDQAWLAKLLLQDGAEIRSLGLLQQVRQLHRLGRSALILAPVASPPALSPEAVGSARDPG